MTDSETIEQEEKMILLRMNGMFMHCLENSFEGTTAREKFWVKMHGWLPKLRNSVCLVGQGTAQEWELTYKTEKRYEAAKLEIKEKDETIAALTAEILSLQNRKLVRDVKTLREQLQEQDRQLQEKDQEIQQMRQGLSQQHAAVPEDMSVTPPPPSPLPSPAASTDDDNNVIEPTIPEPSREETRSPRSPRHLKSKGIKSPNLRARVSPEWKKIIEQRQRELGIPNDAAYILGLIEKDLDEGGHITIDCC